MLLNQRQKSLSFLRIRIYNRLGIDDAYDVAVEQAIPCMEEMSTTGPEGGVEQDGSRCCQRSNFKKVISENLSPQLLQGRMELGIDLNDRGFLDVAEFESGQLPEAIRSEAVTGIVQLCDPGDLVITKIRESLLRVAYQMPLTCARIANVTHRAFELGPHQRGRTLSCWVELQ